MERAEIRSVLRRMPRGRTVFRYFPGRYAFQLLRYGAGCGASVAELKQGRFGRLLRTPEVRARLAALPDGRLDAATLEPAWPVAHQAYRLGLGVWGSRRDWRWHQLSRPGYNLVLQLNFAKSHVRDYERWLKPEGEHPFVFGGHPTAERRGEQTLAWARLDVDLATRSALVEEIQQDWIREVDDLLDAYRTARAERRRRLLERCLNERARPVDFERYVASLAPHRAVWDEAMLSAALWLLVERLGIERVWYHTDETGRRLKGARGPRSLYSRLPRRFCFERTRELPPMLRRHPHRLTRRMLRRTGLTWYRWTA